jgi:hypothetical protein
MTHGTIIQFVHGDGRTYIIIIVIIIISHEGVILTLRGDNKLHQNGSSLYLTKTVFSHTLIEIPLQSIPKSFYS